MSVIRLRKGRPTFCTLFGNSSVLTPDLRKELKTHYVVDMTTEDFGAATRCYITPSHAVHGENDTVPRRYGIDR